ncbi:ankyrin repeat protein [Fowlpox virus]|nr:ankyrin repeat protein [Fowlpox virus]AXY05191.1 ankyrin repeat protein [Fowlpox virus]
MLIMSSIKELYHAVSINDRFSVVNILEKKNIPIDYINFHPDNPLLEAVKLTNTDMIKTLLDYGICINTRDILGNTALHLIAMDYYVPHNDIKHDHHNDYVFKMVTIINLFLRKKANINACNNLNQTPLHLAAESNNTTLLKILLYNNAKVNILDIYGNTCLHYAVRGRNIESIKLLLSYNVDVNIRNFTYWYSALHEAVQIGDSKISRCIVSLLLCNKANVNTRCRLNTTPIFYAINCIDTLKLLLENGADVNATSDNDNAVIHLATENRRYDIIKTLLDYGADVNMIGYRGKTPLYYATENYSYRNMKLLLDHGSNPNIADHIMNTPLFISIKCACIENTKMLLDSGADINHVNDNGETPISYLAPNLIPTPVAILVISHIVLLKTKYNHIKYLPGFIKNISVIQNFTKFNNIKKVCEDEFRFMRSVSLSANHNLSSYICNDNLRTLVRFIKNPKIYYSINKIRIYRNRLYSIIERLLNRKKLHDLVLELIKDIGVFNKLPLDIISMILDFLSDDDLALMAIFN